MYRYDVFIRFQYVKLHLDTNPTIPHPRYVFCVVRIRKCTEPVGRIRKRLRAWSIQTESWKTLGALCSQ